MMFQTNKLIRYMATHICGSLMSAQEKPCSKCGKPDFQFEVSVPRFGNVRVSFVPEGLLRKGASIAGSVPYKSNRMAECLNCDPTGPASKLVILAPIVGDSSFASKLSFNANFATGLVHHECYHLVSGKFELTAPDYLDCTEEHIAYTHQAIVVADPDDRMQWDDYRHFKNNV